VGPSRLGRGASAETGERVGRQVSLCLYADLIAAFILYLSSSPLLVLIVVGRLSMRFDRSMTRERGRKRQWEVVCAVCALA